MHVFASVARSGVVSLGGSLVPGLGQVNRFSDGTDQLHVTGVSLGSSVNVASALSPRSVLFPILVSLPYLLLFPPLLLLFLLPPPSFLLSLPLFFPLPLGVFLPWSLLFPLPPLPSVASAVPSLAPVLPRPGAPLPSPPLSLSSSSMPAPSLPSSFVASAPSFFPLHFSAPPAAPSSAASFPPISSSFSSASSSFMDFASYQAHVLGLSQEYQSLARWFVQSRGTDFLSYLSSFYPHLSADASRDFSSPFCSSFLVFRSFFFYSSFGSSFLASSGGFSPLDSGSGSFSFA